MEIILVQNRRKAVPDILFLVPLAYYIYAAFLLDLIQAIKRPG
jgi:hypothetical protein